MVMAGTIIDEGDSMSILSSTSWKALGLPSLFPEMRNMTGFDKGTSRPLGILSKCAHYFEKENRSRERDGSSRTLGL